MIDAVPLPPPVLAAIAELVCQHVDHTTLLFLMAAVVTRFWHRYMWAVYLAHAIATAIIAHH